MICPLQTIVSFLNDELKLGEIQDYPNAFNGLQIENAGEISSIATAVDASERAMREAVDHGADLLIVHHGLYWSGLRPVTGAWKRKLQLALDHNLAVYSVHLPLDIHPTLGNNVLLAKACGISITGGALPSKGHDMGIRGTFPGTAAELAAAVAQAVNAPVESYLHLPHDTPGDIIVCSGGAGGDLEEVVLEGAQTYITGEGAHWNIPMAEELGVNLIFGGHYATETFGVRALGRLLSERFGLPCSDLDIPPSRYSAPIA